MTVLIAGGGIAGAALALACHRVGLPARVFEAVADPAPLGVGINLQPNAVRELTEGGLAHLLPAVGVATREWGLFSTRGLEIWTEPRGLGAGYAWPQWSVHRGRLQLALLDAVRDRLGPGALVTGARVTGWDQDAEGLRVHLQTPDGPRTETGAVLVGADGLHSAVRARLHPDEGAPIWSGKTLWRGAVRARPFRTGASMALIGSMTQRFVAYPISEPDAEGLAEINWIAELALAEPGGRAPSDWSRAAADVSAFLPAFEGWRFGWIDCPALVRATGRIWEYPMVDRDPLPFWTEGRVTLMGDAAHVMWPVGSNGASQAILDASELAAAMARLGPGPAALAAYEAAMRPMAERMIRATRAAQGPDALLGTVEDRCGGVFAEIDQVIPRAEMAAFQDRWRATAGLAREALNAAPPRLPPPPAPAPA